MKNIAISGSTGFVGSNLVNYIFDNSRFEFISKTDFHLFQIGINIDIILHFAGKAHDFKKISNPDDYYYVNTELTKNLFDKFIESNASVFLTLSSVKAVADSLDYVLTEDEIPNPMSHYGKSKLLAEKYILSKQLPLGKRVYILRPCMIHGPGNKGNLNLLYNFVSKGLPWPLGLFNNSRSYLSIDNLCFIIKELIEREDIPSGVYNVADDVALSTNEVIKIIAESKGKKVSILKLSTNIIKVLASVGEFLKLPLNKERLQKLTECYVVSNTKIKKAIGKQLPVSSKDGLLKTFESFTDNV